MSFSADITLTDDSAGTADVSSISVVDSKRIWREPPLATPTTLTVSHQTAGKGESVSDRHLARLDKVKEDTEVDGIATLSGSVFIVVDKPRRIFTDAEIEAMAQKLCNWVMVPANFAKLLNGEV